METNKIICGNNIDVTSQFNDEFIDLVITSPPYDLLRKNEQYKADFNFEGLANELNRVLKKGGIIVWVVGDGTFKKNEWSSESGTSFKQALYFLETLNLNLQDTMIYEKDCFAFPSGDVQRRYHQIFEYMFVFSKGKPKVFNPLKDKPCNPSNNFGKNRRQKDGTMKYQKITKESRKRIKVNPFGKRFNIWRYKTGHGNSTKDNIAFQHPAIFPEALARDHIYSWSNEGDIVLDPFSGSGTTSKMAYIMNRKYIGIDVSKEYCNLARERISLVKDREREYKKILRELIPEIKKKESLDKFF